MKTIFKSQVEGSERTLQVLPGIMTEGGTFRVELSDPREDRGIVLSPDDVPDIMLALSEASGIIPAHSDSWTVGEPDNLARIAADLQHHIERRDARTKEAADREALESDARTLFEAGSEYLNATEPNGRKVKGWDAISDRVREAHVVVARKARELRGGTK